MKISLLHHWLVSHRGGERVLDQLLPLFPDSPIYTLIHNRVRLERSLASRVIISSTLQYIPFAKRFYKQMLPLYPFFLRHFSVKSTDFLFSTDASIVKGARIFGDIPHVCYCHSPPRYLWDMKDTYIHESDALGYLGKLVFNSSVPYLRKFDCDSAQRVSHFIANSKFVQKRIKDYYNRESIVINPPCNVDDFEMALDKEDFYLVISALTPYKRIDLAIEACNRLNKKLVVIGSGSEERRLRDLAGPTVEILGQQPFSVLVDHYKRAKALLFPGIEDFGITPLEAMASGTPVIALGKGGVLETVMEGETGLFFKDQDVESISETIETFESQDVKISAVKCRERALEFSPEIFRFRVKEFLVEKFPELFPLKHW